MKVLSILIVFSIAIYIAIYGAVVAGFVMVEKFSAAKPVSAPQTALPINYEQNTAWGSNYQLQPAMGLK
jgi:flagellar basal body-associated protein FliL